MRVLVAPQAYKGSLTAPELAAAITAGVPREHDVERLPLADGGEGTVEVLLAALGGERRSSVVEDPLGRPVEAGWAMLSDGRAAVEMAAASGLPLVGSQRDPRRATTFGTGQLIRAALDAGASEIVLGIGGSATNDGGAFALEALGARLLDRAGRPLPRSVGHLQHVGRVDVAPVRERLAGVRLRVMCDVTNPLLGPSGATAVYGPQKGVNEAMRPRLEAALERWAEVVEDAAGRPLRDIPGAGAAGGLGFGLLAVGATLEPGAETVLDLTRFDERVRRCDLVITGEGRLDGQSAFGKVTLAVARRAREAGVPVLAIVGGLGDGYEAAYEAGLGAVMPIVPGPLSLEEAQSQAKGLATAATDRAFRMIELGIKHASGPRRQ